MNPPALCFRAAIFAAAAATALLCGCVTEREGPERGTIRYRDPAAPVSGGSAPVGMPTGPVATPAPGNASLTARVQVAIVPLGQIAYDAQVLPLVSPDTRFLASEEGEAPTWDLLLGKGGSLQVPRTRIGVYDVSAAPARRIADRAELPPGVLLGRSADDNGFLVEWARDDGSRWIGRIAWTGGAAEWLVKGESVNAHALLTPQGELVFTRAQPGGEPGDLIIRRADGSEDVRHVIDGSFAFPIVNASGDAAGVMKASAGGLEIETYRILREGDTPARWGPQLGSRVVARRADLQLAYAIVASGQGPMPARATPPPRGLPFIIYEPGLKRTALLDIAGGGVVPLASGSIAAVPWRDGYLCSLSDGLVWTPHPKGAETGSRPAPVARIVDWPAVPRPGGDGTSVVLVGPSPDQPDRLVLARMQ